jgi:hypothetical protein
MTEQDHNRCEQLLKARAQLRRHIEILEAGPVKGGDRTPQFRRLLEELRLALGEIEIELGIVEPGADASDSPI